MYTHANSPVGLKLARFKKILHIRSSEFIYTVQYELNECVCMHVYVHACVHVCACMCMCVYMWGVCACVFILASLLYIDTRTFPDSFVLAL